MEIVMIKKNHQIFTKKSDVHFTTSRNHFYLRVLYIIRKIPIDAIPDLSDVQVIIYTPYPGQAPQVVKDQITYPLTSAMLAVPYAKIVRGYSFFWILFGLCDFRRWNRFYIMQEVES
jgi:Cu/Ag efflux pump CusA